VRVALRSEPADSELRRPGDSLKTRADLGRDAERAAEEHLVARGYRVLERNLHVGRSEIDLLVQHGDVVAIVEVRMRGAGAFAGPLASVDAKKRAFLIRAAERLWRERWKNDPTPPKIRFDVVGVRVGDDGIHHVEHIAGAFTA
jgi:putative endonuclease